MRGRPETCVELAAAGKFHESRSDPHKAKAANPHFFLVEGKEVPRIDLDFFLINVRPHIILNARIETVDESQSCMLSE